MEASEFPSAITAFSKEEHGGLIALPSPMVAVNREMIVGLAIQPACHRSFRIVSLHPAAGLFHTVLIRRICIGEPRPTLVASLRVKSQQIYPFNNRQSTSL